jgi:hypothetical protein
MELALKFLGIAIEAFIISSVLTKGFRLVSEPSDAAVTWGFLLIVLAIAVGIGSLFFWFPNLRKFFKHDEK